MGVHDDFVELGGNSLLAVALIADVNRVFNTNIPVSALFRDATIRVFAERLCEQMKAKPSFVCLVETVEAAIVAAASSHNLGVSPAPRGRSTLLQLVRMRSGRRLIARAAFRLLRK